MKMDMEEGDECPNRGCDGVLVMRPPEYCLCHISSPCHMCVDNMPVCPKCGWAVGDFVESEKEEG